MANDILALAGKSIDNLRHEVAVEICLVVLSFKLSILSSRKPPRILKRCPVDMSDH
jgi:hypothetical protein